MKRHRRDAPPRTGPAFGLARAARISPAATRRVVVLAAITGRGRCAQILAGLAASGAPAHVRAAAAVHRACPPAARVALRSDRELSVRWAPPAVDAATAMSTDECVEVKAVAAARRACPSSALRRLANDDQLLARAATASNPSTPSVLLVALGNDDAFERVKVATNPATPWWWLEHLARDVSGGLLPEIASNPSTPPRLLAAAALGDCLCRSGCQRGRCRCVRTNRGQVLAAAMSNPSTPQSAIDELAVECGDDDVEYLRAVVRSQTSPIELSRLAAHSNRRVGDAVAAHRVTSTEVLRSLALEPLDKTRVRALADNPNCPPDLVETLLNDPRTGTNERIQLAANPSCPPETVARLALDPAASEGALPNPVCDPHVLAAAAFDPETEAVARIWVASNPSTPTAALKHLLTHPHSSIRDEARSQIAVRSLRAADRDT